MNRLTLIAAVFAAICNCFVVSALAEENRMKMFGSDGKLEWDTNRSPGEKTVPEQNKENRMDGTGRGRAEDRLKQVKQLFDRGLISKSEYQTKRSEILRGL